MTTDDLVHANSLVDVDEPLTRIAAADFLLGAQGIGDRCKVYSDAVAVLYGVFHALLDAELYGCAATLCWGQRLFNHRPRSVRSVWRCLGLYSKLLIMGAGAMTKSYSTIARTLLNWSRDPQFTTTKLISTTAGHERAQSFSTLVMLHRRSAVPLPGFIQQGFIGLDKDDRRSSIAEVAIEKGVTGIAGTKLQGFHSIPRPKPHPTLGLMSRVEAVLEEAEGIPNGVWQGVANLLTSRDSVGSVRVVALTNPRLRDSQFALRAEPIGGWREFDLETSKEWESKLGWHVLRLDGKDCENVQQRRVVFPGLITYEGYMEHVNNGGADEATFARGAYPVQSVAFNFIPPYMFDHARGYYTWVRMPTSIASLDPAFEEDGDKAKFTSALYGEALGFTPEGGAVKLFSAPRHVIQVEQIFEIQKQNTDLMCTDIIEICRALHVRPEWFVCDRSGNATGLYDLLRLRFGNDILGLQWGQAATELRILEEDSEVAAELYDDLVSEMYFSFARWLEFGYIAFAPALNTAEVFAQFTARKYRTISKVKRKIQSKKDFKKDTGRPSPDDSDSVVQLVHLCRTRGVSGEYATMKDVPSPREKADDYMRSEPVSSVASASEVDRFEYVATQ